MTEPFEPSPRDNGDFDIDLKKAILIEALGTFSTKVLADDLLFSAISTTLRGSGTPADSEPDLRTDFSVTPNVKDGTYSLCLEESARGHLGEVASDSGAIGDMFFKFATMKYISVCAIEADDTGKPTIMVDKPFVELALSKDVALDKISGDEAASLESAVRTVLQGVNDIVDYCLQRGVEVVPDEFGRPQLLEIVQNTYFVSE